MGSRAGFRVPPPPAVDLRVGELFPGGRWKHRTSSPSTTSTLMVEIAATTKKSMAVPERRCMRRWSSGLRVVKWAKKRCTTKPPIHAQWKEGEVSKKARPAVLGGRTRSSTRTSSRRRCRPRLGGFLNDDARAARRWLLTDPMARSQTGPRDR